MRIEHIDDPDAPQADSLVPAASAIVTDDQGRILLIRRTDNGLWSIPGGKMEIGESIGQTVVREVQEETGLEVQPTSVVGIYTNPHHVVEYSDGEVRQQFSICFRCEVVGGTLTPSDESSEVVFVHPDAIAVMDMTASMRRRIKDYLRGDPQPVIA